MPTMLASIRRLCADTFHVKALQTKDFQLKAVLVLSALVVADTAFAQKKYDVGASDTEIKIGNTTPYSGPVSIAAASGKIEAAYFKMINDKGGVNGRMI